MSGLALWLGCDVAGSVLAAGVAPGLLLSTSLEQEPQACLEVAVVLLLAWRACVLFALSPGQWLPASQRDSFGHFAASALSAFACGTLLTYATLVLFGAPMFELWQRTLAFSGVLSSLAVMPVLWSSVLWKESARATPEAALHVFASFAWRTPLDRALLLQSYGALGGAWLGAIPIPLDWDRPWQAWPVTLVYGSLAGFCAASVGVVVVEARDASRKTKET